MKIRELVLDSLTAIGSVAVVLILIGMVRRGDFTQGVSSITFNQRPQTIASWPKLVQSGHRIGPANARMVLVEFGDFQCPACKGFASSVDTLLSRHPKDLAVVFHHFPMPYHSLAYPLAIAAECASSQGRFPEFYRAAYGDQDQLGLISVTELAERVVPDTAALLRCLKDPAQKAIVDRELALARSLGVQGTPGIAINGKLYGLGHSLQPDDLDKLVADTAKTAGSRQ